MCKSQNAEKKQQNAVIHFFQGLSYNKDEIEIPVLTSDTWESPYKSFLQWF